MNHLLFMDDLKLYGSNDNEMTPRESSLRLCLETWNAIWIWQMCCVEDEKRKVSSF